MVGVLDDAILELLLICLWYRDSRPSGSSVRFLALVCTDKYDIFELFYFILGPNYQCFLSFNLVNFKVISCIVSFRVELRSLK